MISDLILAMKQMVSRQFAYKGGVIVADTVDKATIAAISSPYTEYEAVRKAKHSSEKDKLVVQLIDSGFNAAYNDSLAVDVCQRQCEIIQDWCSSPVCFTDGQLTLISNLFGIGSITRLCILTLEPVFDLYVVGISDDVQIYDDISACIVRYKYDNGCSAAYMYMTESEFAACDTKGVIKIINRD